MNKNKAAPVLLLLAMCASAALAEHPIEAAQRLQSEATAAYQAGDYEGFTRSLEQALELNPASFVTRYNLACGYARIGRADQALELLEQLTNAQVDFGMANDPDLASLRELPKFVELVAKLEASIVPVSNSTEYMSLGQLEIMPEGIARDPATGRLFFGSMRTGEIYVSDARGQWSRFASVADAGPYSAIGMSVDAGRGVLWVVGTWFFLNEAYDAEKPAASGLFGFDLASGELLHSHFVAPSVQGLNDVVVAANGDLYVSGSELHVLRAGTDELVPMATNPAPFGSNGLTLTPDGSKLLVASYPVGIGVIDTASGELRYLESPPDRPLYGIDGLYWHDGDLIGIQNGIQPWRLLRIGLNDDLTAITGARVIEFANRSLTPTTGAIAGAEIYYIGQAPAPAEAPSQFPAALAPFLGKTVIMTAPLDAGP